MKLRFEMEECTRCGGSGAFSYNALSGSVCFKCKGSKRSLSRKGLAAKQAYETALEARCSATMGDIRDGDRIRRNGKWTTVARVVVDDYNPGRLILVDTRHAQIGVQADHPCVIFDKRVVEGIMRDISDGYRGATLVA